VRAAILFNGIVYWSGRRDEISIAKFFPLVLILCLAQPVETNAQISPGPSSAPYSREDIDSKIDLIQKEINAIAGCQPYSKAETKLDGIRSDLKILQGANPYSKSETDTKLGALEKPLGGTIDALRQTEDDKIRALNEKVTRTRHVRTLKG
jgi:hypothetical protein